MVVAGRRERAADHPVALPLLSLIGGIHAAAAHDSPLSIVPLLFCLILLCIVPLPKRPLFFLFSLAAACWGFFFSGERISCSTRVDDLTSKAEGGEIMLQGVVTSSPRPADGRTTFPVSVETVVLPGGERRVLRYGVMVTLPESSVSIRVGDRIRFGCRPRKIAPLGLPGEPDPVRNWYLRGVYQTVFLPADSPPEILGTDPGFRLERLFEGVRERLARRIDRSMEPASAGVARAIILGDRRGLSREDERLFARAGVNHILSVSGFHVGVVAGTLVTGFRLIGRIMTPILLRVNLRTLSCVLSFPPVVAYLFVTDAAPATVRSTIMFALLLVMIVREREYHLIDLLTLSGFSMLALEPSLLYRPSFQLSFMALWGIVVLEPLLTGGAGAASAPRRHPLLGVFTISAAAIIATSPLVAWHFGTVSLAGLVANPILVPLLGCLVVVSGFAALFTSLVSPLVGDLLFSGTSALIMLSLKLAALFAGIPALEQLNPSSLTLFVFIAGLVVITFHRNDRIVAALFTGVAISVLTAELVTASTSSTSIQSRIGITFLSLGQAEATLFRLPDGTTLLVDTGGRFFGDSRGFSERHLVPALRRLNVRRIDHLVLSHPHPDHAGGLPELLSLVPVGEILASPETLRHVTSTIPSAGGRFSPPPLKPLDGESGRIAIGSMTLDPLWPLADREGGDLNDRSLVLRVGWGKGGVLLTGDIGWEVADHLVDRNREMLPSTILKVPHHGSRHSSSPRFVAAASPRLAVLFAGRGNRFGLPSPEALAEIHGRGIPLWRTDLDGTLSLFLDREGNIIASGRQSN